MGDLQGKTFTLHIQSWSSCDSKRPRISNCPRRPSLEIGEWTQDSFSGVRQASLHVSELQFWHKQGAGTNEAVNLKTKRCFVFFKRNTPRNEVPSIMKRRSTRKPSNLGTVTFFLFFLSFFTTRFWEERNKLTKRCFRIFDNDQQKHEVI